jgi:hypothetical protein
MSGPKILIVHSGHMADGSTATLAGYISSGAATRHGASVIVKQASAATITDVVAADAIILGSPTVNGNMSTEMSTFLDMTLESAPQHAVNLSGIIGGVFCTSGSYDTGAQPTLNDMLRELMTMGASIVGSGSWHASQGVCALVTDSSKTHPLPGGKTWEFTEGQTYLEEDANAYGARVADIASFYRTQFAQATGAPAVPGRALTCAGCPDPLAQLVKGQKDGLIMTSILWTIGLSIILTVVLAVGLRRP